MTEAYIEEYIYIFSWPHSLHTDRRLGIPWGHVELDSKDAGIGLVVIGVGRRFKSRVSPLTLAKEIPP